MAVESSSSGTGTLELAMAVESSSSSDPHIALSFGDDLTNSDPPPASQANNLPSPHQIVPTRPRRRHRASRQETLRAIQNSIPHKQQLQHYRDEEYSYRSLVESNEEICRIRTNDMYQLLGIFAVFEGVVVSAVSQSTVLTCRDVWSPILLAVTACLYAIAAMWVKLGSIAELKKEVQRNKDRANAMYGRIEELKLSGMDFDFNREPEQSTTEVDGRGFCRTLPRKMVTAVVIMLIFTGFIVYSCLLLCKECKCARDVANAPPPS